MVGAGIFALFGEAGAIAGAAVWVSFLIGGIIALLQGYSFAKLGARYPSKGGMISWLVRGSGPGLFTGGAVVPGATHHHWNRSPLEVGVFSLEDSIPR